MNPVNPLLRDAMAEVAAVIKKYDIAGVVCLSSGEQSEYLNAWAENGGPSWTCYSFDEIGLRLKAKARKDLGERYKLNSSVKMVFSMRDCLKDQIEFLNMACMLAERNLRIEHGEVAHEGHE